MYGKVQPCDFLCHPDAADLIMLTVEVLAGDLEVRFVFLIEAPLLTEFLFDVSTQTVHADAQRKQRMFIGALRCQAGRLWCLQT